VFLRLPLEEIKRHERHEFITGIIIRYFMDTIILPVEARISGMDKVRGYISANKTPVAIFQEMDSL
jgi:hypothetical protein